MANQIPHRGNHLLFYLFDVLAQIAHRGQGAGDDCRATVEENFSRIGLVKTGRDVDQRALAGSVFSNQPLNPAGMELKIYPIQRENPTKSLRNTRQKKAWVGRVGVRILSLIRLHLPVLGPEHLLEFHCSTIEEFYRPDVLNFKPTCHRSSEWRSSAALACVSRNTVDIWDVSDNVATPNDV